MNALILIIIGIPILEILVMINLGQQVGAINTILLILFTAIVGVYYARIEGLNTIRSGFVNLYKNKVPVYEMISGASIAVAAILLIIPGFITDLIGFVLLFPFSRKILINRWIKKNKVHERVNDENILDGEIVDPENKKDDL